MNSPSSQLLGLGLKTCLKHVSETPVSISRGLSCQTWLEVFTCKSSLLTEAPTSTEAARVTPPAKFNEGFANMLLYYANVLDHTCSRST